MNHALMICNMLLEDVAKDPSRLKRAQEIAEKELGSVPSEKATTLSDRLKDFAKPPYSEYDRLKDQGPQVSSPSAEARTSYEPLTQAEIERLRPLWASPLGGDRRFDILCNMAVNCLLYAQEIDRLRSASSSARVTTDEALRDIARKHAHQAVCPVGSFGHADYAMMQEQFRAEEVIFYALKEAASLQSAIATTELSATELDLLIDHHDTSESEADAMGMEASAVYHRNKREKYSEARLALNATDSESDR